MKIRKNISKLIGLSLFISNFSLYPSMATSSNEIPNRYETLEGEYITIDDSIEGEIKDIEILGNTIQNEDDLSDIKSVGDKVDEKELYEIPIVSTGKNLIYDSTLIRKSGVGDNYAMTENYFKVKPNTNYTIQLNSSVNTITYMCYDKNKQLLGSTVTSYGAWKSGTLSTIDDTEYIQILLELNPTIALDSSLILQLEEGVIATEYEPYQEEKLTILSPTPLEKVGDVADRIIYKNGVWGVEKNIKTTIFNGNEDWGRNGYGEYYLNPFDIIKNTTVICDKFQNDKKGSIENYIKAHPSANEICIKHTATQNLNAFKEWLSNNNVLIKYQTTEPQFIPLPNSQQIKLNTFLDKTHIFSQTENGVNPTLKVTVDRLNKMALDAVDEVESNPTIENLANARNLVNHMDESNLKEQLQQRLNNISALNDLQLERKTSTSNVDIYIKSENMLSMALSTNNITFEDYSGVDDLEQSNTIKISINSSLPYQLNSYLVSEIQNADGGKIIDKDRLNIKDNSDTDYKEFTAINNKLILKDNCNAGNDLSHYIDLKLNGGEAYPADIYKTVIKFEAEQK